MKKILLRLIAIAFIVYLTYGIIYSIWLRVTDGSLLMKFEGKQPVAISVFAGSRYNLNLLVEDNQFNKKELNIKPLEYGPYTIELRFNDIVDPIKIVFFHDNNWQEELILFDSDNSTNMGIKHFVSGHLAVEKNIDMKKVIQPIVLTWI